MGVQEYLDQTEVYLVSYYDGFSPQGCKPSLFDWSLLHDKLVVSHNANFDAQVFTHLQRKGIVPPDIKPKEFNCTANLAAFMGAPRSLEGASKRLLKTEHSKDIRTKMRGKKWEQIPAAMQLEVRRYAQRDSELCWTLWNNFYAKWPKEERFFSLLTLQMCSGGIYLDAEHLEAAREMLFSQKETALDHIPWRPPLSMACLQKKCVEEGITPPRSLAMTDEECDQWMEMYRGRYEWVDHMRNYRRCNMLDKKIDKMLARQRADGRMPYELKYWGSHTGRDSGSGGINVQNMPHGELYGADLRASIMAPPGFKLVIADLEQIEARILLTLVKDAAQLELINGGMSPYVAHARTSMGYTEAILEKTSPTYRLAKARVLALGYGAGWRKFNVMAYLPMYLGRDAARVFAAPVTKGQVASFSEYLSSFEKDNLVRAKWKARDEALEREWTNSWLIVRDYRATNYRIVKFWKYLDEELRKDIGRDYSIKIPSGRWLRYSRVKESAKDGVTAEICRGDKLVRSKLYGGRLCENIVQALARDIFRDAATRVALAGYRIIMRVHDELVCEVPASTAEADRLRIATLMSVCPSWLSNCPVSAEAKVTERYLK